MLIRYFIQYRVFYQVVARTTFGPIVRYHHHVTMRSRYQQYQYSHQIQGVTQMVTQTAVQGQRRATLALGQRQGQELRQELRQRMDLEMLLMARQILLNLLVRLNCFYF